MSGIKNKKIFITGATGILGKQLLRLFLFRKDIELVLLIRGKTLKICKRRYVRLIKEISEDKKILAKINIVSGDITKICLGLNKQTYSQLCNSINEIYHCAALADFNQPFKKVQLVNIIGTKNMLKFAERCVFLARMNYVSTAFIVGSGGGRFDESDLRIKQGFNSPYEKSKFQAEILVRKYLNKKFTIAIFRPSIIVGEFYSAKTANFQMFYQYFRSLSLNLIQILPLYSRSVFNIIPCDVAAKAIFILSQNFNESDTYHIISAQNLSVLKVTKFASKYIGFKEPKYVDVNRCDFNKFGLFETKLVKIYFPFLNFRAVFYARKTINKLRSLGFVYPKMDNKFIARLFDYAIKEKFIIQNNDKSSDK